jgi:hypothetical protein
VTRHHNTHRNPARRGLVRNTAEPSGELSVGDIVAAGDVLLAVGRPAGWEPVTGPLTEVRTREHGTNPLPDPGWLPGAGTRADQVPAIRPGAACGSRSPGRPSGTEGEPA